MLERKKEEGSCKNSLFDNSGIYKQSEKTGKLQLHSETGSQLMKTAGTNENQDTLIVLGWLKTYTPRYNADRSRWHTMRIIWSC